MTDDLARVRALIAKSEPGELVQIPAAEMKAWTYAEQEVLADINVSRAREKIEAGNIERREKNELIQARIADALEGLVRLLKEKP